MVDFTTPNLCGASEAFNKVISEFASIKDTLKNQLEGEIDTLKSELASALNVIETDIRGLISELPEVPDISLISEIQNFLALPAGSQASLNALTSLTSQFGEGLAALGQDLDSIISAASSALSDGIDLCGGTIPNFVIGPDGLKEKPQDSGMPDKDPTPELVSALATKAEEILLSKAALAENSSAASIEVKITLPSAVTPSESGNISNKDRKEYDKIDAIIKAKLEKDGNAPSPQVQKVTNALAVALNMLSKNQNLNPDENQETLKELQNRASAANNNMNKFGGILNNMIRKVSHTIPQNINASGTKKIVKNDSKSIRLEVFGLPEIEGLADTFRRELSFVGKHHSISKLADGLWRDYYSSAREADLAIKQAFEANRPEIEGNAQEMKKRIDKILLRVIDVEKKSERYGKIYDEMNNKIEETYSVELDD